MGGVGGGGREGGRWNETAGGLEQCRAVEVAVGKGEDEGTSDGALNFSAEEFQGLKQVRFCNAYRCT